MACEICEHCQIPISRNDKVTINEGYSYHKACHKCYVCSETNLANAEVFKGVIFCSICAQRIFQGCYTARKTKTKYSSRARRTRSKSHRRERERMKAYERRLDGSRDGIIERARLVGSNSDIEDLQEQKDKKPSKVAVSDQTLPLNSSVQGTRNQHVETVSNNKKDFPEIGITTVVTQELLNKITSLHSKYNVKASAPPLPLPPPVVPPRRRHTRKRQDIYEPVPTCCDLRIAELGMSTEIANMALRKNSEFPVTVRSNTKLKRRTSYTVSLVNIKLDKSDAGRDFTDSAYSTIDESETSTDGSLMDRRLGSILKLPLKLFKKNILDRSSLVSVLVSSENERSIHLFREIKRLLREEVVVHQAHGIKRLYSTINRRNRPYKLGWVSLRAKVSRDSNFCCCSYGARCKHFRNSHSYRCMRAQVMKLAGPTSSELAVFRGKVKKFLAPQFVRNILTSYSQENPIISQKNANSDLMSLYEDLLGKAPAIKLSAACQKSWSIKTQALTTTIRLNDLKCRSEL